MTKFSESDHPRGQATNPGQFRAKPRSAPDGGLTDPARSAEVAAARYWVAVEDYVRAESRMQDAELRMLFAQAHESTPDARTIVLHWDDETDRSHIRELLDVESTPIGADSPLLDAELSSFADWQDLKTRFLRNEDDDFLIPVPSERALAPDADDSTQLHIDQIIDEHFGDENDDSNHEAAFDSAVSHGRVDYERVRALMTAAFQAG